MCEDGTLKSVTVILKRGSRMRENNGRDGPNWGTLHPYMDMPQQNPLYNYYTLIKRLKITL
jgi:hypothetical protein